MSEGRQTYLDAIFDVKERQLVPQGGREVRRCEGQQQAQREVGIHTYVRDLKRYKQEMQTNMSTFALL